MFLWEVGRLKWLNRLALAVLIISLIGIGIRLYEYDSNRKTIERAQSAYHSNESHDVSAKAVTNTESVSGISMEADISKQNIDLEEVAIKENKDKFNDLLRVNGDFVGWINIPDTEIDYPVVKGQDNEFYLKNGFDRKKNVSGAIFMDYRNSGNKEDRHVIIYGHNMKNGTMFKGLMNYKNRDFYNENRIVSFETGNGESLWEIFSVYVTGTEFYYIPTEFSNESFHEFALTVGEKSMYDSAENLDEIEEILTLSTCSYEFDDARFVVHARRMKVDGAKGSR